MLNFGQKLQPRRGLMRDHVRILLIDDDEEDFLIVADMLAESKYQSSLDWVHEYGEGLKAISRREHDVYLLDYFMAPTMVSAPQ